ncbi:MAG: hypothetical protein IPK23_05910 [Rhizobiales bacterium]|nr:hypothetical protein [Hyphomicrobiales bacterium]
MLPWLHSPATLTIQVGSGAVQTVDLASGTTLASLTATLEGLDLGAGISATLGVGNAITITSTSSETITIGGTGRRRRHDRGHNYADRHCHDAVGNAFVVAG